MTYMEDDEIFNTESLEPNDTIFATNTRLSKEEREFFLNYNEADEVWVAESSIPKFWRKLEKKNWTCTGTTYYPDGQICSKTFTSGNKKGVSITDPTAVRHVSEENKEKARQRFAMLRSGKDTSSDEETISDE